MDIQAILSNEKDTVILCKSSEYEAVKKELTAYFESMDISRIFTHDKAFFENGNISNELKQHLESGYEYEVALPKINYYANTSYIISQMRKFTDKVIAILPDCPNYGSLFLNVINYNA